MANLLNAICEELKIAIEKDNNSPLTTEEKTALLNALTLRVLDVFEAGIATPPPTADPDDETRH